MQKSILIFGGGQQGSLVARDLIENGHHVVIADKVRRNDDIPFLEVDVASDQFNPSFRDVDLVICALPAWLGERCVWYAIHNGVDCVDLSFTDADLKRFDAAAVQSRCTVLADCGLAPGLPNLVIGYMLSRYRRLKSAGFYVGGIAQDPKRNELGYVPSWSIPDLCSEYTRPARIAVNGKVVTLPAPLWHVTSDLEIVETPIGNLEAFYSDGVRSMLSLRDHIPTIIEKTLRWPGHIAKIQEIAEVSGDDYNIKALERAYSALDRGTDDVVVLEVWGEGARIPRYLERYILVCRGNEEHTAMARTTGHSCAAFAELVLQGYADHGVLYPEDVSALRPQSLDFVVEQLAEHGVQFK